VREYETTWAERLMLRGFLEGKRQMPACRGATLGGLITFMSC
jgi:hypothetical protein